MIAQLKGLVKSKDSLWAGGRGGGDATLTALPCRPEISLAAQPPEPRPHRDWLKAFGCGQVGRGQDPASRLG